MLRIVHFALGIVAGLFAVAFIGFGAAAHQFLDPDRSFDDTLTTLLTPSRRPSDFVGPGWRYQKLQWLSAILAIVAIFLFGLAGAL